MEWWLVVVLVFWLGAMGYTAIAAKGSGALLREIVDKAGKILGKQEEILGVLQKIPPGLSAPSPVPQTLTPTPSLTSPTPIQPPAPAQPPATAPVMEPATAPVTGPPVASPTPGSEGTTRRKRASSPPRKTKTEELLEKVLVALGEIRQMLEQRLPVAPPESKGGSDENTTI